MSTQITLLLVFAGIGILNTLYLSYHSITKKPVRCLFFPEEWCRTVQYSPWSRTMGIPNSFAGFGFYSVIFVLTILFAQGIIAFWLIQAIIVIGFLFSLYFTFIQAFVLKAFCTWCVLSALDFTALLLIAFLF